MDYEVSLPLVRLRTDIDQRQISDEQSWSLDGSISYKTRNTYSQVNGICSALDPPMEPLTIINMDQLKSYWVIFKHFKLQIQVKCI